MTDKLQQEKVTRWMPLEGSCLEVSGIGWFVRYEDHRAAATLREKEIEELRAKLEAVPVAALQSINSFASEYAPEDGDWPTEDEFDQADRWLSTVTK